MESDVEGEASLALISKRRERPLFLVRCSGNISCLSYRHSDFTDYAVVRCKDRTVSLQLKAECDLQRHTLWPVETHSLTLLTRADMSTVRFRRTKVRFRGRNMILRFQFTKCGFCADGSRRRLRVYSLHAARSLAGVAFVPTQLCPQPLAVFTSLCYNNTCGRMSYL